MERVYIFDCDRIIGDEEKRTIIENMNRYRRCYHGYRRIINVNGFK